MKSNAYIWILLGVFVWLSSCKGVKETTTTGKKATAKFLVNQLNEQEFDFDWFSGKAKMAFDNGEMKQSFTANIRMKKDSIVWISLTGFLGIEGARVLVTPDSIKIIDHLSKKIYNEPISYIQQFVPIEIGIKEIQGILVGEMDRPVSNKVNANMEEEHYVLDMDNGAQKYTFWLHLTDYTVNKFRLQNPLQQQELMVMFADYKEVGDQRFSYNRNYNISDPSQKITLNSSFSKVKFDEPTSFPFNFPSKYSRQ